MQPLIIIATPNISWLHPEVDYPRTPQAIAAEAALCQQNGATILHTHAEGKWKETIAAVRARCDIIVQCGMSSLPIPQRQEPDILRYFPRADPWPREKADKYIAHHLSHWQERGCGHWAVVTPADGQVVGWNGLEFLPETGETEVAYLLSQKVWGQGYATEAARAALQFGFANCSLEEIIGLTHPENLASQRVLEKCGLKLMDRKSLWGMELCRYGVEREDIEILKGLNYVNRCQP